MDRKARNKWMAGLQRAAAVLLIPLLGFCSYLTYKNFTAPKVATPETVWQTLSTPPGVKSSFYLPDSTRVWLNSASSITFPGTFVEDTRQVRITGEAFLDVRKNEKQPFIVDLGKVYVKVLGTRFDVIHYEKEKQSEIILESGKISLFQETGAGDQDLTTLNPGEMALFDRAQNRIGISRVQTPKYTSWINGKLVFRDDPMDEVVRKLNRWFNVEITIADREIEKYVYTATFQDESIDQILELLTLSAPIRYRVLQREKENDIFKAKKIVLKKKSN
jgi:ferric-dicitrate binding protein FerR (iron transport regulator)